MSVIKTVEVNPAIAELVKQNDGYCPCCIEKTPDTICPCKEFREQEKGVCTCGRYEKMSQQDEEQMEMLEEMSER